MSQNVLGLTFLATPARVKKSGSFVRWLLSSSPRLYIIKTFSVLRQDYNRLDMVFLLYMQLFERVKEISTRLAGSETKLAGLLGLQQRQFNRYLNPVSQRNLWEHLPEILNLYPQIAREWLFFGEGEMFCSNQAQSSDRQTIFTSLPAEQKTMQLIGFAACSTSGWRGTMTIPVPVTPPVWHAQMVAVLATGDSMLPAGIGNGQICFCDPTLSPGIGEACFVELNDTNGAIKLFLGKEQAGGNSIYIFQGWRDKKADDMQQEQFCLHIDEKSVKRVAPVLYIRRRL